MFFPWVQHAKQNMLRFVTVKAFTAYYRKGRISDLQTDGDRLYLNYSGEMLNKFSTLLGPSPEEIRQYLLDLRHQFKWPNSYLAAVLGVSKAAIRKWLSGERNPSDAAKKLIWLVHALSLKPGTIQNHRDIALWGSDMFRTDLTLKKLLAEAGQAPAEPTSPSPVPGPVTPEGTSPGTSAA